jgi:hypothetical protein
LHSDVAAETGLDFARALDLRSTDTRTIVYPGQAAEAERTANWLRGVVEGFEEDGAIWRITNRLNTSTVRIFTEAYQQGIEPILITPATAGYLELYGLEPELYGYAAEALAEGKQLLMPSAPVEIDGEPRLAWWEIDPATGETVSVLDNGLHGAAGDYGLTATFVGMFLGWYLLAVDGATLYVTVRDLYAYVVCNVVAAIDYATGGNSASQCSPGDFDRPDAPNPFPPGPFSCHFRSCPFFDIRGEQENPTLWTDLPAHLCPTGNCGIGRFALSRIQEKPIPLPNMAFGYRDFWSPEIKAQRTLTVADNGGGGVPALALSLADNGPAEPTLPLTVTVTADANFDGDVVVAGYVPDGWRTYFDTIDTMRVEAPPGTPAGSYTILVVARPLEHPDLIVTAQHAVEIVNSETLLLTVDQEPSITVPLDLPGGAPDSIETNDGEAEYPDSAYKIEIGNRTAGAKTFDVSVSGIPAGWVILNGARQSQAAINLEAAARTFAGLYIAPPSDELPPPGSSYNVTVTATDGGALSETENFTWTMPGQGHNFVEITPETIYAGANDTVTFTVRMENVGNSAALFPASATTPAAAWSISPLADFALDAGQSDTQTITLQPPGRFRPGRGPERHPDHHPDHGERRDRAGLPAPGREPCPRHLHPVRLRRGGHHQSRRRAAGQRHQRRGRLRRRPGPHRQLRRPLQHLLRAGNGVQRRRVQFPAAGRRGERRQPAGRRRQCRLSGAGHRAGQQCGGRPGPGRHRAGKSGRPAGAQQQRRRPGAAAVRHRRVAARPALDPGLQRHPERRDRELYPGADQPGHRDQQLRPDRDPARRALHRRPRGGPR